MDSEPPEQTLRLLIALLPALAAAIFAAASAAAAGVSETRLAALQERFQGSRRRAIERYVEKDSTIEARWLVLRVLCVASSALIFESALPLRDAFWRAVAAAALAALAYAIPSEIARAHVSNSPEKSILFLLRVLRPVEWMVAPFADVIAFLARLLAGHRPQTSEAPSGVTEAEVEIIVNQGEMLGDLDHDQSEMIRNVLDFGDLTAEDVMVPRTHVTSLDLTTPLPDVLKIITETQHSRYPVYRQSVDNVIGVLHVKDLTNHLGEMHSLEDVSLETLLRKPAVFVPESQPASTVLKDMRIGRHHLAIVIDEFGGFAGIVTLEDVIEEIVGDIQDEHDLSDPPIVDLGNGRLSVDASIAVSDLNRYLGTDLPDDGDYVSLGGLVVEQVGKVPKVGDKLHAFGLDLAVTEADERHVVKVELRTGKPTPETIPPRSTRDKSSKEKMSAA